MAKYWYLFVVAWRSSLLYRGSIFGWIIVMLIRLGVLLSLYSFAYQQTTVSSLQGISFSVAIWSITSYFLFFSWGTRQLYREIASDFRLGTIENKVNKPYNYLVYVITHRIGTGAAFVVPSAVVAIAFIWLLAGRPPILFSWAWFVSAIGVIAGGLIVSVLSYSLIGLTAAWLQDSEPLFWLIDKTILIFGGSYIPMALFPKTVRTIAELTPFGAGTFLTQIFNPDFTTRSGTLFLAQVAWILILGSIVWLVFRQAQAKLSVNGG